MIEVEICIASDGAQPLAEATGAAFEGGASRIELCRAMHLDGLTPTAEQIAIARQAFQRPGLMVMARPRGGDFCHTAAEIKQIEAAINLAAENGADGAVLGVLHADGTINVQGLKRLTQLSHDLGLSVTFHRAFDVAPEPFTALQQLIECGVDRVLTSGTSWDSREPATAGIAQLIQLIEQANGEIEIVVGGGVNPHNVGTILQKLKLEGNCVSIHAFSGGQVSGRTTAEAVARLVQAAK